MRRVLTSYYRPKPGGFCKRLFRGINALLQGGCEVHYLSVVPFPIQHDNCHFHRFPWPERFSDSLVFWGVFHVVSPFILTYLAFRYRITNIFAFSPTYGLFFQPVRILKKIPLSIFVRADTIENHRLKSRPNWLIGLENILEGMAIYGAHIFGVSDVLTRTVCSRHPYAVIAGSATLRNDISPCCQDRVYLGGKALRFAVVGILEPRKNQHFILEVMTRLDADSCSLDIYGVGADADKLNSLVDQLKLRNSVRFKGWVEREKIWPNVDLLLMPSLHEGAPNALLEALELGIPVLASDIPEHREILPQESLISLDKTSLWSERIGEIIKNPSVELQQLTVAQKAAAERLHFDWDHDFRVAVISPDSISSE